MVQNPLGSTTSVVAQVRVPQPPAITLQPADLVATIGSSQTLTAAATGRAPLACQWLKQGVAIPGETNLSLIIPSVRSADLGSYSAMFANTDGSSTSRSALVSLALGQEVPPVIVAQPQDTQAIKGSNITFSAVASGTAPLAYQWQFNGTNLAGKTLSTLALSAVNELSLGNYAVVVTNAYGATASSNAHLALLYLPMILSQPTNATVVQNSTLSLSLSVSNTTDCYWMQNGALVLRTNKPQLTIANAQVGTAGTYVLTCSNAVGSIDSKPITVTIMTLPAITAQPMGLTVVKGGTASLSVGASGSGALSYQWFFGSSPITWATQPMMTLTNAQPANEGYYSVKVTSPYGTATSSQAPVTVQNMPVITGQLPAALYRNQGTALSLSVGATGRTPFTYKWMKNGGTIASATAATLSIPAVQGSDAGTYTVQVGNSDGAATSSACAVTVCVAPYFVSSCQSLAPQKGSSIMLSANIGGTATLTYQWCLGGTNVSGAIDSNLTIPTIQPSQEGTYSVTAANAAGSITQNIAIVTVKDPPVITQQPTNALAALGAPATLAVSVSGRAPLTYQWYKGSSAISDACSSSYTITSCQAGDADKYYALILNSDGSVCSGYASISLINPATITLQPKTTRIPFGGSTNLFATYNSAASVTMEWYKDGFIIPGATNSSYAITSAAMKDEGDYVFYVQNSAGGTNSETAHLTVTYPPVILSSPKTRTVNQGATVFLDVSADGRAPMTFTWMKDSRILAGPSSRTLTL